MIFFCNLNYFSESETAGREPQGEDGVANGKFR